MGFWRRHRWLKWVAISAALLLVALGVMIAVTLHRAEPMLREVIVERLEGQFHARVELASFHMSLMNGLWAEGKGLKIWPPAQVEGVAVPGAGGATASNSGPPLIQLDDFRFHAPLRYDPKKPITISVVELRGLSLDIPPKSHFAHAVKTNTETGGTEKKEFGMALLHFVVNAIECKDAHLKLETIKPGKLPLEFDIAQIKLTNVSADGTMHFDAQLTNPRPKGIIDTSGWLGPWDVDDPGETPIQGSYNFQHADLGVFKGIAGILDSTGDYKGALRNLEVDGRTTTPDFRLTVFGTPLPLETQFHATVDGTNGDTWLHPVNAVLGSSHFTVEGQIVRSQALTLPNGSVRPAGHDISLKVNIVNGRMEDFMRLTSKSGTPLLTGDLTSLKTTLDIPPGSAPVHERMKLNGNFVLDDAHFTSQKIQNDIGQLSLRGQGEAKDAKQGGGDDVDSTMQSDFQMASGVIQLPDLKFTVPGAEIDMTGAYGVEGGTLDFQGTAKMQATVSQMVGGWKGFLLKPADRFFKKDGAGTEVPIHVSGTREDPKFGVDFGRMKYTHPETPGQSQ